MLGVLDCSLPVRPQRPFGGTWSQFTSLVIKSPPFRPLEAVAEWRPGVDGAQLTAAQLTAAQRGCSACLLRLVSFDLSGCHMNSD